MKRGPSQVRAVTHTGITLISENRATAPITTPIISPRGIESSSMSGGAWTLGPSKWIRDEFVQKKKKRRGELRYRPMSFKVSNESRRGRMVQPESDHSGQQGQQCQLRIQAPCSQWICPFLEAAIFGITSPHLFVNSGEKMGGFEAEGLSDLGMPRNPKSQEPRRQGLQTNQPETGRRPIMPRIPRTNQMSPFVAWPPPRHRRESFASSPNR